MSKFTVKAANADAEAVIEEFLDALVGVAICDTVDGNCTYQKSFRPLGHESRDIGQFIDDDGMAYLNFEDRPFGFRIAKFSKDYLTVEQEMSLIPAPLAGGAIVHYDRLYYQNWRIENKLKCG